MAKAIYRIEVIFPRERHHRVATLNDSEFERVAGALQQQYNEGSVKDFSVVLVGDDSRQIIESLDGVAGWLNRMGLDLRPRPK